VHRRAWRLDDPYRDHELPWRLIWLAKHELRVLGRKQMHGYVQPELVYVQYCMRYRIHRHEVHHDALHLPEWLIQHHER
jgi:hypothetical protein